MTHTISFMILYDLEPAYGPIHMDIGNLKKKTVKVGVMKLAQPFLKRLKRKRKEGVDFDNRCWNVKEGEEVDPSTYYFDGFAGLGYYFNADEVVRDLSEDGYYCWNRFEKYYVIAFAIDYVRFEVFSKYCDKELIKWRENDTYDEIKENIEDDNYNENPVITLLRSEHNE